LKILLLLLILFLIGSTFTCGCSFPHVSSNTVCSYLGDDSWQCIETKDRWSSDGGYTQQIIWSTRSYCDPNSKRNQTTVCNGDDYIPSTQTPTTTPTKKCGTIKISEMGRSSTANVEIPEDIEIPE